MRVLTLPLEPPAMLPRASAAETSQLAVQLRGGPLPGPMMPRSDEVSATWEGDGKLGVTFMTDPDGVRQGPVRLASRRSLMNKHTRVPSCRYVSTPASQAQPVFLS